MSQYVAYRLPKLLHIIASHCGRDNGSVQGGDCDCFIGAVAASRADATSQALMSLYGKRWGIECGLRDAKDPRFGMGSIHISTPERRDRLCLPHAFAIELLILHGAAGKAIGYDRYLKLNITKRRTHSLFRQDCMLYDLIPTMPELRLLPLIERFATMLAELPVFADAFGAISK